MTTSRSDDTITFNYDPIHSNWNRFDELHNSLKLRYGSSKNGGMMHGIHKLTLWYSLITQWVTVKKIHSNYQSDKSSADNDALQ